MSFRPAPPAFTVPGWTIPVWAPSTNYPAGSDPWSGQPCKVVHPGAASVGFTPDTGAAAENFNQALNDAYTADGNSKTWSSTHGTEITSYVDAILDAVAQGPVHAFGAGTTMDVIITAVHNPVQGCWLVCGGPSGGNDIVQRSQDPYGTWPAGTTEIAIGARVSLPTSDIACATDGGIVAVPDGAGGDVQEAAAATWTKHIGALSSDLDKPMVIFEPVSQLWCIVGRVAGGATGQRVYTSPMASRTVWTLRTGPAGVPNSSYPMIGKDGVGGLVQQWHGGTNTYFSKSTDGGITWSATVAHAIGFTESTLTRYSAPVWTGSHWVAVCADTAAFKTTVWNSPDGVTWTQVASLASTAVRCIAACGELICGLGSQTGVPDKVVFSVDAGVTWNDGDRNFAASATGIFSNGVRFAAVGAGGKAYFSHGNGMGTRVLT